MKALLPDASKMNVSVPSSFHSTVWRSILDWQPQVHDAPGFAQHNAAEIEVHHGPLGEQARARLVCDALGFNQAEQRRGISNRIEPGTNHFAIAQSVTPGVGLLGIRACVSC